MWPPAVEVIEANAGHAMALAKALRQQDQAELVAAGEADALSAICAGVERSDWAFAVFVDGELACIFGVAPLRGARRRCGVPWMLGTSVVRRRRRVLARLAKTYIDRMLLAYPRLFNAVHARNEAAVRWLRAAGFTVHEPLPHSKTGEPFHPFEMSR